MHCAAREGYSCVDMACVDAGGCVEMRLRKTRTDLSGLAERESARPGVVGQYDPSSPFEPIKIIQHYNLNFSLGNVIKYVLRAGKKPGVADIEDLEKARQYIEFEINRRKNL